MQKHCIFKLLQLSYVKADWLKGLNFYYYFEYQKKSYGSDERVCKIGNTNAAVLPLPVLAHPKQSRPNNINFFLNIANIFVKKIFQKP